MRISELVTKCRAWLAMGLCVVAVGCAQLGQERRAPSDIEPGTVTVTYADPSTFTDALTVGKGETNAQRREWILLLCEHLAERTRPLLAPGERLEVQILDVRRAGAIQAAGGAGGAPARVVSDASPPRIELEFKRVGADGEIVQIGRRTLEHAGFMHHAQRYSGDSLRYERALLDGWVAQEFGGG